ncbi:MAG: HEPN domain-containing protein [Bacteroidetes bacterium]|nr:HEPN domain-containing protein [Bacteroidota bacterium]
MIDDEKRKLLVVYRIEQAKETISEAELLFVNQKYRASVNRVYYGMFYCILALGLKYCFETSKHQQLIGWFNKNFIHTGKIQRKYGEIIKNAFRNRNKGDYETEVVFNKEQVDAMISDMKEFIGVMELYLTENE